MAFRMRMASIVCSSTVKMWYVSNCIWPTMRAQSGSMRPMMPLSFMVLSQRAPSGLPSGSWPQTRSRNNAPASGSARRGHGAAFVADQRAQCQRVQLQLAIPRQLQHAQHQDGLCVEIVAPQRLQHAVSQHEAGFQQGTIGFGLQGRLAHGFGGSPRVQPRG